MSHKLPDYAEQMCNNNINVRNALIDPTGVIIGDSISDYASFSHKEVNTDKIITQTLEGYVLPLLPTVPLQIHNIHLKSKVIDDNTSCYHLLQLPSHQKT